MMSDLKKNVEKLIKPVVRGMHAYHVPDASGFVKLDAMENPYLLPDELRVKWQDFLGSAELNRYPNPSADKVREKVRQVLGVPEELEIMFGNGSDELIQILIMSLAPEKAKVFSVEPSFVMYKVLADTLGVDYCSIPLTDNFGLDLHATLEKVEAEQPGLLFFANPNNPTGNCIPEEELRAVIEASKGLVVLDEAYMAFTDSNLINLAVEYDNVLVMRTLSKVGLAGLRLGMLFGKPEWVGELNKIRMPYNINVLTQLTAEFLLDHYDVLSSQTDAIRSERSAMSEKLSSRDDLQVFPSEANFILFRTLNKPALDVFNSLKEQGVLVKCLANGHPLLADCIRVTVSTPQENAQFLAALDKALDL